MIKSLSSCVFVFSNESNNYEFSIFQAQRGHYLLINRKLAGFSVLSDSLTRSISYIRIDLLVNEIMLALML